jgi:hypothetical protein
VSDCFSYYNFDPKNKVAEVELSGDYYLDRNSEFYGVCIDALSSEAVEVFYGV